MNATGTGPHRPLTRALSAGWQGAPVRGRPRGRALMLAAVLALLAGGCTVGPSQRPPVAVRGMDVAAPTGAPDVPVPPPAELPEPTPQLSTLRFTDCTDQTGARYGVVPPAGLAVECGELPVPVDAVQPQYGSLLLDVVRVGPAGASLERPPLLVLGDTLTGGGAGHAVTVAAGLDPAVLDAYTVIGLDRRGTGTDRLACAPPDAVAALVDADPTRTAEEDLAALLESAREVVQGCTVNLPGVPTAFGSAVAAADVEQLRVRLGVPQLSAVGAGDGAAVLDAWARSAPGAVGRLVLDGPPDPDPGEPARTTDRAAAASAALDAFAAACAATGGCPLGADPEATVAAVVTALRDRPLAVADGRRLTAGSAQLALVLGLSEPDGWPALAAAFAAAGAGDAGPLLDVLAPVTGPDGRFTGLLATACNDGSARPAPAAVAALVAELREAHPLVGDRLALGLLACAPWPAVGTRPGPAPDGLPPVLVLGTAADPRAPLPGSRRAADALPAARFVRWEGAGTGAYPRTACVRRVVDTVLVDGRLPGAQSLCPP